MVTKGMKVKVYRNLNTGLISVYCYEQKRVLKEFPCHSIVLENCKAVVQEGGRQRVLRDKQKNVHAFIVGHVVAVNRNLDHNLIEGKRINYNPYRRGEFYDIDTNESWSGADRVAVMVTDFGMATIEA